MISCADLSLVAGKNEQELTLHMRAASSKQIQCRSRHFSVFEAGY